MTTRDCDEILEVREGDEPISRSRVMAWMKSDDPEALGALHHFLAEPPFRSRIQPPLSFEDHQSFAREYFGLCLRDDPDGDWADSRYSAGWELVQWLASVWEHRAEHPNASAEWKDWIANIYKAGDEELRTCIVNATLEHLFEEKTIRKFYSDWTKDPILAVAYESACEWSAKGGSGFPR